MLKLLQYTTSKNYLKHVKLLSLFFIVFTSISAHTGSIKGVIIDISTSTVISKVSVTIEPGNLTAQTNDQGAFLFSNLPEGNYTINCYHLGYIPNKTNVFIKEGMTEQIEIMLEKGAVSLPEVNVSAVSGSNNLLLFNQLDIKTRPITNGQDLMRLVPGMVLAQHAGGGKAEQMFFRGFDIDHGTDIAISVDGIPVNMVSHAHGQGYADCHFVIPEIIGSVNVSKGPYNPEAGNLATSGSVEMTTVSSLENSFLKLEAGKFNTYHLVSGLNFIKSKDQNAYIAGDILLSDGYFQSPQYFKRYNFFGKYITRINEKQSIKFSLSLFNSSWNASGQIPNRAVKSGIISYFGAIDPSEGGFTSRNDFSITHYLQLENIFWKNQVSITQYNFELYSDFTFFLRDPINGDQIRQKEKRSMLNYASTLENETYLFDWKINNKAGLQLRNDEISNSELSYTKARYITLKSVALGNSTETNLGIFAQSNVQLGNNLSLTINLRYDFIRFIYDNLLDTLFKPISKNAGVFLPKLSLEYIINNKLTVFAKTGYGFHSNDIRSVIGSTDKEALPKAIGLDLGFTAKPYNNILLQLSYWQLRSANELVYVGDEGIVEQNGSSERKGLDFMIRYQPISKLFLDVDANYSHGRLLDAPEGANRIPLAPEITSSAGVSYVSKSGLNASLRYRYVGKRPADESNTIIAKSYFLIDLVTGYKFKNTDFSITIQNLFNSEWREAQFETTSRLKDETVPVTEIHYTPGTPFNIKAGINIKF